MAAQERQDLLDVNIAQRLRQQRTGPARKPLRGGLSSSSSIRLSVGFVKIGCFAGAACLAALPGLGAHCDAAKG